MLRRYFLEPWGRLLRQPAFLAGVLLLGASALGMRAGGRWLQWNFRKEAVPLRKPLDAMDRGQLRPYQVVKELTIPPEILREMGTEDYIDWYLEDTEAEVNDPARYLHISVTYYTGNPDKVPHVPDQCLTASGARVSNGEDLEILVPDCGGAGDKLPIRVLDVEMSDRQGGVNRGQVGYFFAVNGDYRCRRSQVRLRTNNWRDRYAYFSKVEISILGQGELTREDFLAAAEKLCRTVAPLLWREHWPDWPSWAGRR